MYFYEERRINFRTDLLLYRCAQNEMTRHATGMTHLVAEVQILAFAYVYFYIQDANDAGRCAVEQHCVMKFLITEEVSSFEIFFQQLMETVRHQKFEV